MTTTGETGGKYVSLAECARRICVARQTLYNWISIGKVGSAQGLRYVGDKPLIEWPVFEATMIRRG